VSKRPFGPAPEPKPHGGPIAPEHKVRPDPEAMRALEASTADLGFSRPSSPPERTPPTPAQRAQADEAPAPRGGVLKCDVGGLLFEELRLAAVQRRVTVKYLLVEALRKAGYKNARLEEVSSDGRRERSRKR
jgi:hypothetical protein